ncbi:unnamed protein product, partial [Owenia fusiformis]
GVFKMSALKNLNCKNLIYKTYNYVDSVLFKDKIISSRICTNLEITRGRRRTSKPAPFWARKKTKLLDFDLTKENRNFVQEVAEEKYVKQMASPLREPPWERHPWTLRPTTLRAGVLGIKLGVLPQWTVEGKKIYVTLYQVLDNHVIRYTPPEEYIHTKGWKPKWKRPYGSLVVGALSVNPTMYSKPYNNLFLESGVPPKRKMTRFLVTPNAAIQPGTPLDVRHFRLGQYVDVQAKTIGHGFQGVMKRWGMKGGPASHGSTKFHRKMGATGGGGDKAAIWKGKKMPGHMGMDWNTNKGNMIVRINYKYNILYVTGSGMPGPNLCYSRIYDSQLPTRKGELENSDSKPLMPTYYPEDGDEFPEEVFHPSLHQFTEPSVIFDSIKS